MNYEGQLFDLLVDGGTSPQEIIDGGLEQLRTNIKELVNDIADDIFDEATKRRRLLEYRFPKTFSMMDYDYSLIPPKCPECRAMPINDETPKWMYREFGECYCKEEQEKEA